MINGLDFNFMKKQNAYGTDITTTYNETEYYQEFCLVRNFFEQEAKKPIGLRSKACMIHCPCQRCNPYTLLSISNKPVM